MPNLPDGDGSDTPVELQLTRLRAESDGAQAASLLNVVMAFLKGNPPDPSDISTALLGGRHEVERGRIASTIAENGEAIRRIARAIAPIERVGRERLEALLEHWVRCVSAEPLAAKRARLTNCLAAMMEERRDAYDEQDYFLKALCGMNEVECGLLAFLYDKAQIRVDLREIRLSLYPESDPFLLVAAAEGLHRLGLVETDRGITGALRSGYEVLHQTIQLSTLGRTFCRFWTESRPDAGG